MRTELQTCQLATLGCLLLDEYRNRRKTGHHADAKWYGSWTGVDPLKTTATNKTTQCLQMGNIVGMGPESRYRHTSFASYLCIYRVRRDEYNMRDISVQRL